MSLRSTLTLLTLSMTSGCEDAATTEDRLTSELQNALSESSERSMVGAISGFADRGLPERPDALGVARDLVEFIQSEASCSAVSREDNVVTIDFSAMDDSCEYLGNITGGSVVATLYATDSTVQMDLALTEVTDDRATASGDVAVSLTDAEREISGELEISHEECDGEGKGHGEDGGEPPEGEDGGEPPADGEGASSERQGPPPPPRELTLIAQRVEAPLNGDWESGVVVNGTISGQADEGDMSGVESGLEIRAGELVPQAGTLTRSHASADGEHSGEMSMTFSRVSEDAIQVDISGPEGEVSIQVDPVTGEAL